jgi:short-subunit dehydrogenase
MALPTARDGGAALITGASSGIGEEFARQLAARGYELVLVAWRADRLKALAAQLGPQAVRAEVEVADLQAPDQVQGLPSRIAEQGLEIDLLVNNAGFGHHYGAFAESRLESEIGQIRVNVEGESESARRGAGASTTFTSLTGDLWGEYRIPNGSTDETAMSRFPLLRTECDHRHV